ncbi:MAG: zf-HC2 domain-containing protein [Gammaproteobacteria bacterium]|jgi:predicted anti-sigma-YlaC factor YlaD
MLKCAELAESATEYLEGSLTPLARFRVRVHLLICEQCRVYMRQLRMTARALRLLGAERTPGEQETEALIEKLREARARCNHHH